MTMKILAFAAALALPSLALADVPKMKPAPTAPMTSKLADDDLKLVAHVHAVNGMEMDMGKLAIVRGTPAVKKYGTALAKDHQDGDKDLTAFAKAHGVTKIPADVPPSDAEKKEHDDMMAKAAGLKKLRGADFDREFLMMMTMGHDSEIAKLDAKLPGIKDTDLAAKMKDLRPVLQRHADAARELQKTAPTASK